MESTAPQVTLLFGFTQQNWFIAQVPMQVAQFEVPQLPEQAIAPQHEVYTPDGVHVPASPSPSGVSASVAGAVSFGASVSDESPGVASCDANVRSGTDSHATRATAKEVTAIAHAKPIFRTSLSG